MAAPVVLYGGILQCRPIYGLPYLDMFLVCVYYLWFQFKPGKCLCMSQEDGLYPKMYETAKLIHYQRGDRDSDV